VNLIDILCSKELKKPRKVELEYLRPFDYKLSMLYYTVKIEELKVVIENDVKLY
jgi:hypothetical protein